jgi:hypothetical protein
MRTFSLVSSRVVREVAIGTAARSTVSCRIFA